MEEFFQAIERHQKVASGIAIFLIVVIWFIADAIREIKK